MRLVLTVLDGDRHGAAPDGELGDVVVDADDGARVEDLIAALVRERRASPGRGLWCGVERLDPRVPLAASSVRHGSVLGLGGPVPGVPAEPGGLVEVRVVGGPGAGSVVRLDVGEYSLGPAGDVPLADPDLPAVCARLLVRPGGRVDVVPAAEVVGRTRPAPRRSRPLDGPVVVAASGTGPTARRRRRGEPLPPGTRTVDPAEDPPLVHLGRREVRAPRAWPPAEHLAVGRAMLAVGPVRPADASLSPSPTGATDDLNRPPRLLPPGRRTSFALPAQPRPPDRATFPLLVMLVPVVMGVGLYLLTGSVYSLAFVAMSPLMALASWSTGARQGARRHRREVAEHARRTRRIQDDALAALARERSARHRDFADPAEVLLTATGPRARLWERRPGDHDFLHVRVGTADQASEVSVQDPARETHEGPLTWTAPDVPVVVPLAGAGVTGIAAPAGPRRALARWVLAQAAVLHSPVDVDLVLLTGPGSGAQWEWARWLPHLRRPPGSPVVASVGTDGATTAARVAELGALLDRRARVADGEPAVAHGSVVVVLDGARTLRLLPGVPDLLQRGPAVGICFVCLDDDERLLPEECRAVVTSTADGWSVRRTGAETVDAVSPDLVDPAWAEQVARALAPVRDVGDAPVAGALPTSSRLLALVGADPVSAEAVVERWERGGRSTRAVLGEGADGPVVVDLVRDGPHALVAGTTGSGKSELLQTLIASLALDNRPDELGFLLVDYKGGAAFKDCAHLPHTLGTVTDLDGHLTGRALESLRAELRRRERVLADAGAKDLDDLQAQRAPGDPSVPRLVIVIDELAALVSELPGFVSGLVDIARRGRSLGVHLVLATQRPAGVVSAEITANTNLRVALRVTDRADSADVIGSPEAAAISRSTPGRALVRAGQSRLVAFQSGRVGGRPRGTGPATVRLRPLRWSTLGASATAPAPEEDASTSTDLGEVVRAARLASEKCDVPRQRSPWLPPLPDRVVLDELVDDVPGCAPTAQRPVVPFGLVDVPAEQRRDVATLDLAAGRHLAIVSAPRAGRSTALRAVAGAIGRWTSPEDVHVHAVDCGSNALLPLVGLPHVGAVVGRDDSDRMTRLAARLRALVTERQQALAAGGFADVAEQRAAVPRAERMAHVVVLLDRWEGLVAAYDHVDGGALVTAWQQILAEGGAVGITAVVTGDRTLAVGRTAALLGDRLVLRMTEPGDFSVIGLPAREVPETMVEGRGFRAEGLRETQVALLDPDPSGSAQVAALQRTAREATARWADVPLGRRALRVDALPARIGLDRARALPTAPDGSSLVVAVGGDTLDLRTLDPHRDGPALLVTGARRTGRSTALLTMATFALEHGWQVVVVTPRPSPLRALAGRAGVHGPFDATAGETEVTALLADLRAGGAPSLTLVDDVELLGADGWLPRVLERHLEALRDTGSVLVGAGSPDELGPVYRGPVVALKRAGAGLLLAPQSSADGDLLGVRLPRSAVGAALPPGGGHLVRGGRAERVQVVWPH